MKSPLSAATSAGLPAAARAGLAVAGLLALTGCAALTSPATIIEPYDAGDGTTLHVAGSNLTLANFLVIGQAQGQTAAVSGSVINSGASPVRVALSAGSGTPTTVTVPGNSLVRIGPDQVNSVTVPSLPVVPGPRMNLTAQSPTAGSTIISVPVLRPVGYYTGLTPSPTPVVTPSRGTAADTPTPTPTPTS